MKETNRIAIKLNDGREIVAEYCNYDGDHPEIAICIQEDGIAIQDICLVRPYEENTNDHPDVDCLVWSDNDSDDYTHKFIIEQYTEEQGGNTNE